MMYRYSVYPFSSLTVGSVLEGCLEFELTFTSKIKSLSIKMQTFISIILVKTNINTYLYCFYFRTLLNWKKINLSMYN